VTCGSSRCQAPRAYSLIRPPRTGFRRIRLRPRSATLGWPPSYSPSGLAGRSLVRPGPVAVHLVFTQDGAQMAFPEDQHAVQEFTAQGTDEALADRVHPRRLDGRAHNPDAGGLEYGVERGSEVRSTIADQEPDVLEPLAEGESEVAGLLNCPVPVRVR